MQNIREISENFQQNSSIESTDFTEEKLGTHRGFMKVSQMTQDTLLGVGLKGIHHKIHN